MKKKVLSIILLLGFYSLQAGPPFNTDDPEPVKYKHWEYYISSINFLQSRNKTGTLPHFEINYGLVPNVQVHIVLPLNYTLVPKNDFNYGYSNTELGIKYRVVYNEERSFQIGTFPILEVPTVNNKNFGNNLQVYLPVWLQKSWDKLTTYGGGGYWINPGTGNRNWLYAGWEVQYDFTETLTLGGELFYHTQQTVGSKSFVGFNAGGFINFTDKFHFIFSAGHSITPDDAYMAYAGLLWTI